MFRTIAFLAIIAMSIFFGGIIADVAQIPMLAGVGSVLLPAFLVNETSALYFGASLKTITRPAVHSPGAGGGLNNDIIAVLVDDIDLTQYPTRGLDGVTITTNLVLKTGKYMHVIYSTPKKLKPVQTKVDTDDNPDITAYEVGLEFWHPGLGKAILEFQAMHGHSKFLIILRECAADTMYLLGDPCDPLHMKEAELQWEATPSGGKGTQFGIKGEQKLPFAIYEGSLTLEPADASGSPSGV